MPIISNSYSNPIYRNKIVDNRLHSFDIRVGQTDLLVSLDGDFENIVIDSVRKYRSHIEKYIENRPDFLSSLQPLEEDAFAQPIIKDMLISSRTVGVGPMASVAGAIAQYVGRDCLSHSKNVIVENGGDIYLNIVDNSIIIAVFAGKSPLSYKVRLKIQAYDTPCGICTSSGSVGHSLSFGKADAVCVVSNSAVLSDAAATYLCNLVERRDDIEKVLEKGMKIEGIRGIVIIYGDRLGVRGEIELT